MTVKQSVQGEVYSYTVCCRTRRRDSRHRRPIIWRWFAWTDGALVTAQLTDVDRRWPIGDPVEMVTRKLTTDGARGIIVYGYKFRPLVK